MSRETREWLNRNVLVGMTEQRGNVWHYKADFQTPVMVGDEIVVGNHYDGFIPVDHVQRRLFDWLPQRIESYYDWTAPDGSVHKLPTGEVTIAASDNGQALGNHGLKFSYEGYTQLLLRNVEHILDDDLGISSAGLLKNRSVAWVEVSVPETIHTPEGVSFRPNLLAGASFDSSIPTFYKRTQTFTVCDNTFEMARGEHGQEYRVKRTAKHGLRVLDARAALGIIHEDSDEVSQEIARLCGWKVTGKQWNDMLKIVIPYEDDAKPAAITRAENTRDALTDLWGNSMMVAPWKGTAFGVVQAFNTYRHHYKGMRGDAWSGGKVERNMFTALKEDNSKADAAILSALEVVTT